MLSYLSYVPHGVREDVFFPIDELHAQYQDMQEFKLKLFRGKEYEFVLFFNSRNIRRKSIPDTLMAFKLFVDGLPADKRDKVVFVLHTQPIDDNGTNLFAVVDMLFGEDADKRVIFSAQPLPLQHMNFLYNLSEGTILLSSNEGWGLSITESLMAGKMVIANSTGGMQDQMRFEDENGDWIKTSPSFATNNIGKYRKTGEWALPVFPSNISYQGSPLTPFISDDRMDFREAALRIRDLYDLGSEERQRRGLKGRDWVLSEGVEHVCR
jgi:glycosyltransferase involved in cell wall biosynthesis